MTRMPKNSSAAPEDHLKGDGATGERDRFFAVSSSLQVITGADGFFKWVSPTFERILGWTPEEMTGQPWTNFLHPDDIPKSVSETDNLFTGAETFAFENRYRHRDGSFRWFLWNAQAYVEENVVYGAAIDITERKQAEEAVRESEKRFRSMADHAPVMVWITEPDASCSYLSQSWYEFTGQTPETGLGLGWLDAVHPDDSEPSGKIFLEANEKHKPFRLEYRLRGADGEYRWAIDSAQPRFSETDEFLGYIGSVIDITERKSLEQQIVGQNEVLEAVALGKPFAEILHSVTQTVERQLPGALCSVLLANEDGTRLFEGSARSLPDEYNRAIDGIRIGERVGSCGTASFRRETVVVADIFADSLWADFLDLARNHDLRACWSQPIFSPAGRLYGTFAVYFRQPRQPQTEELALLASAARIAGIAVERHRAAEKIRESEEKYRTLFNSIDEGYCIIEMLFDENEKPFDYRFVQINAAFERQTGLVDAIGKTIRDFAPEMENYWFDIYGKVAATGEAVRFENEAAELHRWYDVYAFRYGQPEAKQVAVLFNDITRRKTAERERDETLTREQELRQTAETANRLKDEFLATLSHELRTPLNAILGWSQMLQSHDLGENERAKALAIIERSARSQNQLIEDILDVSRIITGKLRLDVRAVDLPNVITAAADVARPAAEAKNIRLQVLLDPSAGPISGDPDRLQQVVWNLLSNAVKFTEKNGRVQVRLERVNSHVEVVVSDTGKGIETEFLPHVFDRFRQSDGSMTRRHGGLGLGLAIVRQIVELHGGTVSVVSDGADKGATFTISLPLLPVRQETASAAAPRIHPTATQSAAGAKTEIDCPPELAGLRVLLVDDEADSRDLLYLVLNSRGAEVVTAASAAEAFEWIRRERFDILVSDIGMPDEDGFSLIKRIRGLKNEDGENIPAIALTAYARSEDRVRAIRSGFQMHIAKPVEPAELVAVIANYAGRVVK